MSQNLQLWDAHQHIYRNSLHWDKLYEFLALRVRYWVYSARLPLWQGQEEDIAQDILQDALSEMVMYNAQYTQGKLDKGASPSRLLLQVSLLLAYQSYQRQEERDGGLIQTNPGLLRVVSRDESAIWRASALTSAWQEWFCECLAGTIMKIPQRPRKALLTHWANHLRAENQQTRLLIRALSKYDVSLKEFRQMPPADPREQHRQRALVSFAYKQILCEPEQERQIALSGTIDLPHTGLLEEESSASDRELIMLGSYLEATAPSSLPSLAFRKELRDKLLDMLVEYHIEQALADHAPEDLLPISALAASAEADTASAEIVAPCLEEHENVESCEIEEGEIDILTTYLKGMTPLAPIDPTFRATLREKLLAIPQAYAESALPKTADEMLQQTQRFLEQTSQEVQAFSDATEEDEAPPLSLAWLRRQRSTCSGEQGGTQPEESMPEADSGITVPTPIVSEENE